MRVGLDIGSTTIKCVVLDENDTLLYSTYERHYSHILEKAQELLRRIDAEQLHGRKALLSISGSAGMGLADSCGVPFVQEVFSTRVAVKKFVPATDCVIELGGEDAKILFLTNGTEVRMNGSCAGGTGAFIDQMATLLKMSADEMNKAAEQATRTYTIASRCGVFAKSDVQPLINQGAKTEDIAASIYKAVVNQTIAGLAQGRPIQGNILYLGGPLTFSTVLRKSFDEALGVTGTCPENSLLYVALGAALYADKEFVLSDVAAALDEYAATATYASEPPLFASKEEYEAFHARHMSHSVPRVAFGAQCGPVHIGIDSGSTTVKLVVVDEQSQILYTNYQPNLGNPLPLIRQQLLKIYKEHPGLKVASVTTTGYGLHHRHRRSGHEVLQDRGWGHQQHLPERSLLFRLRQLFADLRAGTGLRRQGVRGPRPLRRPPCGSGQPLHRLYEQLGQAGPEGRRVHREYLGGPVHQRRQERAVQGHPCVQPRRAGPEDRRAGRYLLQ